MAFQRFSGTDPADIAFLLNRLGDDLTAEINGGPGRQWGAIIGKPNTFPPSSHTHSIGDVTGLDADLNRIEYDSGMRDVPLASGVTGQILTRRVGRVVETHVVSLDGDFSGIVATVGDAFGAYGQTGIGLVGRTSGLEHRWLSCDGGGNIRVSGSLAGPIFAKLTWISRPGLPTILPGSPA